ncbi:glycosyltransferase [Pelagibacteraceae bacterium]|nr:glycosyltransferase [Pelagibacteraceae bacterium]
MKVIQVLDEISKKNISIVSVVRIISSYEYLSKKSKIIVANNQDKLKKVGTVKSLFSNLFFSSEVNKILKAHNPDIVHIHGIWRPIHFFFMLHCTFLNIPILVQPHGMLLKEALKSKSFLSYAIKLFTLFIFYRFFLTKSSFIAVTEEEKKSINKYFPNASISIVKNPLAIQKIATKNINKRFVYFGRFNKHKNLKEFITAFITAKPNSEWSFHIYGIEDDENYKNELLDLVSKSGFEKSIIFVKPEFDIKKKFKIISESWCNVLLSKSEILSLSVLEAFSVGTQSFVNKKIFFPVWLQRYLIRSEVNNLNLVRSIKLIMNQNIKEKKILKSEMKVLFEKKYTRSDEKNIYKGFLKKILKHHVVINKFSNFSVLFSNLLNSILVPFLMVLSVIFDNSTFAAEIGVFPGIVLLLTQVFSANARSLLLYNIDRSFYDQVINLRFYLGILIMFILTSYQFLFINNDNFIILSLLSFVVYLSWINEINLAIHEKNKSSLVIKFFLIISILFYFLVIADFMLSTSKLYDILKFYLLFHILFFLYHIRSQNFNIKKFLQYFKNQFKEYLAVASSFFNIIGVIIWRISLVALLGKSMAGLFFASFAIASFPGTLFNNIVGQIVTINEKIKKLIYKISNLLFIFYIIFVILMIILNNLYLQNFEFYNFFNITLTSLLGTPFMLRALSNRHEFLSVSKVFQKKIFIKDVMYGISISPIIIILFYLGEKDFLIYSYPLSSFLALFFYRKV